MDSYVCDVCGREDANYVLPSASRELGYTQDYLTTLCTEGKILGAHQDEAGIWLIPVSWVEAQKKTERKN